MLLGSLLACPALADSDALVAGFDRPPEDTRPACYWYWISDNISKPGITKDLEAMARVGIGEAFIGSIDQPGPHGKIKVMTDEWFDAVAHAIREGGRTGVHVGMFNSPGWSQTGGPWVPATQTMRYLVSSEVRVTGPTTLSRKLPPATQPFQDVAVLAYPAPLGDSDTLARHAPTVTCSVPITNPAAWCDDNETTHELIGGRPKGEGPVTVDMRVAEPFVARSLVLVPGPRRLDALCDLLAEGDDGGMRVVTTFRADRTKDGYNVSVIPRAPVAVAFPAVTSKHFEVRFRPVSAGGATGLVDIAELRLGSDARLDRSVEKQLGRMFPAPHPEWNSYVWQTQAEPNDPRLVVDPAKIFNLSDRLSTDGTLNWDVPAGDWVIERIGMTPTGAENSPAPPTGRGFEVDKMSRAFLPQHYDAYVARVFERLTPEERKNVHHVIADSYEQGSEDWTDGFDKTFKDTYGYDPIPWLPVLSGRVVGSAAQSDRFLWDMRRLIADRIATEYVGGMRDVLASHGLKLWLENYGHWGFPSEFMKYGGASDDIGGEFWAGKSGLGSIELRDAASCAHGYGKNEVSAEAFTGGQPFQSSPWDLKLRGDWAMTEGINHFVLHVYIHQPYDNRLPGVNAWFGTEFNRKNTWFDESKTWIDYLRRSQFLLKQGQFVGDIAYFIGDDAPKMSGPRLPDIPPGYNFDWINSELIQRMSVRDGRLVLPSGMSYRLLVLPPQKTMRPELLDKIKDLVADGAAIFGPEPTSSPSLKDYPACDEHLRQTARALWQDCDGLAKTQATFGRGQVFCGPALQPALDALRVSPDVSGLDASVPWTHRAGPGFDIYFLSNQKSEPRMVTASFRVSGRQPELWNAVDGTRRDLTTFTDHNGRTEVPLTFGPRESYFIIFAKPAAGRPAGDNKPPQKESHSI
ncbi:MAG: glycosyl hydrolase [Tepidisphaeraceae bacterium]